MPDTPTIFRSEEELARLPASERIRYRLVGAGRRYHANDNIAEHIREGELGELKAEVQQHMQQTMQKSILLLLHVHLQIFLIRHLFFLLYQCHQNALLVLRTIRKIILLLCLYRIPLLSTIAHHRIRLIQLFP